MPRPDFLGAAAEVIEQLVHQDEGWSIGQEGADRVAPRRDALFIMLGNDRERLLPAELPGDLAPGCSAFRFATRPASSDQ